MNLHYLFILVSPFYIKFKAVSFKCIIKVLVISTHKLFFHLSFLFDDRIFLVFPDLSHFVFDYRDALINVRYQPWDIFMGRFISFLVSCRTLALIKCVLGTKAIQFLNAKAFVWRVSPERLLKDRNWKGLFPLSSRTLINVLAWVRQRFSHLIAFIQLDQRNVHRFHVESFPLFPFLAFTLRKVLTFWFLDFILPDLNAINHGIYLILIFQRFAKPIIEVSRNQVEKKDEDDCYTDEHDDCHFDSHPDKNKLILIALIFYQ